MPDLFDKIKDWLLAQSLSDDAIAVTVMGLINRLLEGGVPISRMSIGRSILHPAIGAIEMRWTSQSGEVKTISHAKEVVLEYQNLNNPLTDLIKSNQDQFHANLGNADEVAQYQMFSQLTAKGDTGFIAFKRAFGMSQVLSSIVATEFRGAVVWFCTDRPGGFSDRELSGLEHLITPLCTCIRVENDQFLTSAILDTYLGRISGQQVLAGHIERGDGQQIDCAIFYSDLRGSVALSQHLDTQQYLDTVNAFFDCTANAVAEYGGEVLKFIGDGVLAIFPINSARPRANMCAAALASAREAFARAAHTNKSRLNDGLPDIDFGIALHVGSVIYGNVGTAKRLDFTATGPAVGMAARVEQLTRSLDASLLATADFAAHVSEEGTALPPQTLRGFQDNVSLVSYPVKS